MVGVDRYLYMYWWRYKTALVSLATVFAIPTAWSQTPTATPMVCYFSEGFEDITTLVSSGWVQRNNSQPAGTIGWVRGYLNFGWASNESFGAQSGSPFSYIAATFMNGSSLATISNWLLSPPLPLQNGAKFSFWTRTATSTVFPDRLQVRMSTNGDSSNVGSLPTDVGDFLTLLLDIDPTYTTSSYPNSWTNYTVTISGLNEPVTGRLAFRYFVESGGPDGANSDYIGIDAVTYGCDGNLPTPTPTPTPPGTPTPTPVPTPTPGTPVSFVSGTIFKCSSPLPNVRINISGTVTGSILSNASGNYGFSFLPWAGTYTVTPGKAAVAPGTTGINTADVIATQRHYLQIIPLSGCRLTAANVDENGTVNTTDVIAIQRFFLGLSTGIANTGVNRFTPANLMYSGDGMNHPNQNYDVILLGDVAAPFVP